MAVIGHSPPFKPILQEVHPETVKGSNHLDRLPQEPFEKQTHYDLIKPFTIMETDMCRSHYVYKKLRQFRAGIESGISWRKRSFGLTRCTWKGFRSFKNYVLSSVVAANLLTIARKQLTAAT